MASRENDAKIREIIREYAFDLYRNRKGGEAFYNVSPRNFFEVMQVDIDSLLSHECNIDKAYIEHERSKLLALNLTETLEAEGHPNTGSEAKRSDFVRPFLTSVIYHCNKKGKHKLRLERELLIENEYVVVNKHFIALVVEIKRDNWDLGRAQNMLEVFVAHSHNIDNGAVKLHTVYGCVSNGSEWEIFSYNSEWKYHGKHITLIVRDPDAEIAFETDNINNMCAILNGMINKSLNSITSL